MKLSFQEINSNLDFILILYQRALDNGDYAKAKDMTYSILQLYRDTYGVNLDNNLEFDHIFHEAIVQMQTALRNSRPITEQDTKDEIEIINMFSEVADRVLNVSDVRRRVMEIDPSSEELIDTYEQGIKDADDQIRRLKNLKKQYDDIHIAIYGKNIPDLKSQIDDGNFNVHTLQLIISQIINMDKLQTQIEKCKKEIEADSSKDSMYRGIIAANQGEIKNTLEDIRLKVAALKSKGVNVDSIQDVIDSNNVKRVAAIQQVEKLRDSLDFKLTSDYMQLMNNIIASKNKYGNQIKELRNIDLTGVDPSTIEGRKRIDDSIKPFYELFDRIQKGLALQNNRKIIYEQSIREVREEQKVIQTNIDDQSRYETGMSEDIQSQIEAEQQYYRQDMMDKLYGNPEKAKKWKEYYELFNKAKKSVKFSFIDEQGFLQESEYITVDYDLFAKSLMNLNPPVTVEDALKLLQLEEYRERIERLSKFQNGDKSVIRELPSYKKYLLALEDEENATTEEQKRIASERKAQAVEDIILELKEDQIYVATNHGATDNCELIAKAIANAGSLVKYKNGRLAYKEQDTFGGKLKAFGHNYASLIGLRTLKDAKTPLGKVGIAALDTFLIATSPFNVTVKSIYRYTPIVGKEAQARRYIKKHAGENSSPYEGRADALKIKRRKEYKAEMTGLFIGLRAWIKATNDNLFFSDRKRKTENDFAERELRERVFPSIENRYILGAQNSDHIRQGQAIENMQQRSADFQVIAGRDYSYNDLISDSDSVDFEELKKQAILGAALEEHGEDAISLRYSKTDRPRDRRFIKQNGSFSGKLIQGLNSDEIDYSNPIGSVVQSDAIDRATREEGINATYTARNYIPYIITGYVVGMAGRYAASKINPLEQKIVPNREKTPDLNTNSESVATDATQFDTSLVVRTPSDYVTANNGKYMHMHRSVWGGKAGGYNADISSYDSVVGFYVEFPKDSGGIQRIAISIPQDGGNYRYLGKLVTEYGLDKHTLEQYINMNTGTFRPDADLYELAAKISNKIGATSDLTGDKLVEMVFTRDDAKAFIESVLIPRGKNGGWADLKILGKYLERSTLNGEKGETIFGHLTVDFDTVDTVVNSSKEAIREAGMGIGTAAAVSNVIEATEKAISGDKTRDYSKRERRQDRADEVNPGRTHRTGRPKDDWYRENHDF